MREHPSVATPQTGWETPRITPLTSGADAEGGTFSSVIENDAYFPASI